MEELDISQHLNPNFSEWVVVTEVSPQLRLDRGLDRLLTLTRRVNFISTEQDLRREDVEWMMGHWPVLETLSGTFSEDDDTQEFLVALVRSRRITSRQRTK